MISRVIEIIEYYSESHSIDFKREQYPLEKHRKKHELLKDISSMANHPSDEDKYLIIGVEENNGKANSFHNINDLIDQASYQQFVNNHIEPELNFDYNSLEYKGYQLAYFRIFNNNNRPYLIKKEVRNFVDNNKIEFREGDGFIRKGTSTDKITRNELDIIYERKFRGIDRKSDIIVTPTVGKPDDDELSMIPDIKYIDIDIENKSNKSIDLDDIEMKVYKSEDYILISEYDLKRELRERENKKKSIYDIGSSVVGPIADFNYNVEDLDDYVFVEVSMRVNHKSVLIIPQKKTEKHVFGKSLFVKSDSPVNMKVEVTIRSDDFPEGELIKSIEFSVC